MCIPMEKARRDLNASDAVFLHSEKNLTPAVSWCRERRWPETGVGELKVNRLGLYVRS